MSDFIQRISGQFLGSQIATMFSPAQNLLLQSVEQLSDQHNLAQSRIRDSSDRCLVVSDVIALAFVIREFTSFPLHSTSSIDTLSNHNLTEQLSNLKNTMTR